MSRIACESFSCTRCIFFVGLASRNAAVLWLQQVLKCPFELLLPAQNFALSTYIVKIVWKVWPTPMSAFSGSLSENFFDHSSVLIYMLCLQQCLVYWKRIGEANGQFFEVGKFFQILVKYVNATFTCIIVQDHLQFFCFTSVHEWVTVAGTKQYHRVFVSFGFVGHHTYPIFVIT